MQSECVIQGWSCKEILGAGQSLGVKELSIWNAWKLPQQPIRAKENTQEPIRAH